MTNKFKALVIDNQNENFTRSVQELDISALKDGNVLVKVDYSSLNYKDSMILKDGGRIVRNFPFVPGIDFSGSVVESEDKNFKAGDRVILTGFRVGEAFFGGFSQYAKVDSNFLIKTPKELDSHKAMMLGTAGFTALLCSFAVKAKEELLLGEKVKEIKEVGGVLNIMGTLLRQAIRNEEKSLYKILFRVQYLLHRIQTKLFGQGKVIESNPQGYALYATKK